MQKHTYKNNLYNRKAFTLIELLIVIAIIGILFVVLVSKVDFATDKAKATGVQTDFRSFQLAMETVARAHQGFNDLVHGDDYSQLEMAINKNLDNKLKIEIDVDGMITMAHDARDPWGTEYHGQYITGNDDKDRGSIVMYSNGADMTFGSDITLTGGMASINVVNDSGKDDYSLVVCYSLTSNGGEINIQTSGFSTNMKTNESDHITENVPTEDLDVPPEKPYVPDFSHVEAGLYETGSNYETLIYSWDELLANKIVQENGAAYGLSYTGPKSDVIEKLSGDLVIPEGIKSITIYGYGGCKNLTSVVLPNSITSLNPYVFHDCTNLSFVKFPDNLQSIGTECFINTRLKSVVLPETLKTIGSKTFYGCTELNELYIPAVEGIGESAFTGCTSLTSVYLPDTLLTINKWMFMDCTSLTDVRLPKNVEKILTCAFRNCNLKSIYFGPNINELGGDVIYGNGYLEEVIYDIPSLSGNFKDNYIFWGFSREVEECTLIIGNNVEVIPNYLFGGRYDLPFTKLEWEENSICKTIGTESFQDCKNITEVNIPDSVEEIGYQAFSSNQSIKKITLGKNIKRLAYGVFSSCGNVNQLIVNSTNIEYVEIGAFDGTSYDTDAGMEIVISKNVEIIPDNFMRGKYNNAQVYSVVFEEGSKVTRINSYAFKVYGLTKIVLPENLEYVGDYAFSGIKADEIILPNTVTYVGSYAMNGSSKCNLVLSESLEYIGEGAFLGFKFDEIIIPDKVVEIGKKAFWNSNQFYTTKIVIGKSVKVIGNEAFRSGYSNSIYFRGEPSDQINLNSFDLSSGSRPTVYVPNEFLDEYMTWKTKFPSNTTIIGMED